jgi:hypothetical protein
MADVETAVYARLSGFSDLTDLVSDRIYPTVAEQGAAYPLVVFNTITTEPTSAMGTDITPTVVRVQVSVYDEQGARCKSVAQQVKAALRRFSGVAGGVTVQAIFFQDENTGFEAATKTHKRDLDFEVCFEE